MRIWFGREWIITPSGVVDGLVHEMRSYTPEDTYKFRRRRFAALCADTYSGPLKYQCDETSDPVTCIQCVGSPHEDTW